MSEMNNQQIKEKYYLNGKRHAVILFIQMILIIHLHAGRLWTLACSLS